MWELAILLATYNGSKYVSDFLDSISRQTFSGFHIFIRDDASTDNTIDVIKCHALYREGRISIILNDGVNKGVIRNFETLMQHVLNLSNLRWIAFADQDDVWVPNKLCRLIDEAKKIETELTSPLLLVSDLSVVNEDMRCISPSFWRYEGIYPINTSTSALLIQNFFPGCSMLMNKSLMEMALPIPKDVVMHDWWVALVASSYRIVSVDDPLILYRQHTSNCIGARKRTPYQTLKRLVTSPLKTAKSVTALGEKVILQAAAYAQFLQLQGHDSSVANDYIKYRKLGVLRKIIIGDVRFMRLRSIQDWARLLLWS